MARKRKPLGNGVAKTDRHRRITIPEDTNERQAILLFTLALKFIPVINMWETREGLMLQVIRPLKRLPLKVLAKPE